MPPAISLAHSTCPAACGWTPPESTYMDRFTVARNPTHEITEHDPTQFARICEFTFAELTRSANRNPGRRTLASTQYTRVVGDCACTRASSRRTCAAVEPAAKISFAALAITSLGGSFAPAFNCASSRSID